MNALYRDLYIEQATDFRIALTLEDKFGVPFDLSDSTIVAQAKKSYSSKTISLNFDVTIIDAPAGKVQLFVNSALTSGLTAKRLVYDIVATNNSTKITSRILEGQIFVSPKATQDTKYQESGTNGISALSFAFPTPTYSWVVNHNLNTKRFIVSLFDDSGNQFYAKTNVTSLNQFVVTLTQRTSGYVVATFSI
jgi:hypothetical protein